MDLVSILTVLLVIGLVGFIVYLVVTYIPMPAPFQQVIIVVCVVLIILWLISAVLGHAPLRLVR